MSTHNYVIQMYQFTVVADTNEKLNAKALMLKSGITGYENMKAFRKAFRYSL